MTALFLKNLPVRLSISAAIEISMFLNSFRTFSVVGFNWNLPVTSKSLKNLFTVFVWGDGKVFLAMFLSY